MSLTMTDLFAGAGGSSTGAAAVPGIQVAFAANHWPAAVRVHALNHPDTDHRVADRPMTGAPGSPVAGDLPADL